MQLRAPGRKVFRMFKAQRMSDYCKEITEMRAVIKEMQGDTAKIERALELVELLNNKLLVMEEYYMSRIRLYQKKSNSCTRIAEERSIESDAKYLNSLMKIRELKDKIEELQVKNIFYKSKDTDRS
jgi:hypothetical protein